MRATQPERASRETQRVPWEGMDGQFTSPVGAVIFILKRSLVGGWPYSGAPCKCKADRLSGEPNESVSTRSLISLSARAHEKSTHQPKAIRPGCKIICAGGPGYARGSPRLESERHGA